MIFNRSWLVFSTYVEMILDIHVIFSIDLCILHVCGDDPMKHSAELIAIAVLHMCGDDPMRIRSFLDNV